MSPERVESRKLAALAVCLAFCCNLWPQSVPSFDRFADAVEYDHLQYFVANGFVVLAPNYRSSVSFNP